MNHRSSTSSPGRRPRRDGRNLIPWMALLPLAVAGVLGTRRAPVPAAAALHPAVGRAEPADPKPPRVTKSMPDRPVNGTTTGAAPSATGVPNVPPAATEASQAAWAFTADDRPRSHRFNPARPADHTPLRSGRLVLADDREGLHEGAAVSFDLGEGLTAHGVLRWPGREPLPGVQVFAGDLVQPKGAFYLEHHARGWAGRLSLDDAGLMACVFPDRNDPGVTRLEIWPRAKVVCSNVDEDDNPETPPPADPSIDHTQLQSRPGSPHVIYLDFDGELVSGSDWNALENGFSDINAQPSGMSREEIIAAWRRSSEDWAWVNVNVTTKRSVYNAAGAESRCMVVITPTKSWYDGAKGGVAYLDSFNNLFFSGICWCWNTGNYLVCAETISHESAHCMGNSHASWESGDNFDEYYDGHVTSSGVRWAPIMGWSPEQGINALTQFTTEGSYNGSTVDEDQVDEIEYELDRIEDTNFDTLGGLPFGATLPLDDMAAQAKGLINTRNDVDSYILTLPAGTWHFHAAPNPCGPNIDVWMELRTHNGLPAGDSLIASHHNSNFNNNDPSLEAGFTRTLAAGTYRVRIGSDRQPVVYGAGPLGFQVVTTNGYSNYGGLGTFTLQVDRPGFESDPPVLASVSDAGLVLGSQDATATVVFTDASTFDTSDFGVGAVVLERTSGGISVPGFLPVPPQLTSTGLADSGVPIVHRATATIHFPAPGGFWDTSEGGAYRIRLVGGAKAMRDRWGNATAATTRSIGSLPASESVPPGIRVVVKPRTPTVGSGPVAVTLTLDDVSPILVTQNGLGILEVVSGSGAPSPAVTRTTWSKSQGGRHWEIDYLITPSGGLWGDEDAGSWSVMLLTGKISDDQGNKVAAGALAVFTIEVPLWQESFEGVPDDHGFSLSAGWQTGTPQGPGLSPGGGPLPWQDPSITRGNATRILGYALSADATQYANDLEARTATTPPIDTQGFENISLHFRRWLTVRQGDEARIEINNATTNDPWTTVWKSPTDESINDTAWQEQEIRLPSSIADNGTLNVRWVMGPTDASLTAGGWNIDDVEVTAAGTWRPARLVHSLNRLVTSEGAAGVSYTVRLSEMPALQRDGLPGRVTVSVTPDAQSTVNDTSLVFTSTNWATAQTITVTAINDRMVEGTHATRVRHVAAGSTDPDFLRVTSERFITVFDNDDPLIATQPSDATIPPGDSIGLRVTLASRILNPSYQWYRGRRGETRAPIAGATSDRYTATLAVNAVEPLLLWVAVSSPNGILIPPDVEYSRQVTITPLSGYDLFKHSLLSRGYTQAQVNAPGFDGLDPDGNGLSHFAEFALGIFPGQVSPLRVDIAPAEGPHVTPGQVDLLLTFGPLQAGVVYAVESGQGADWEEIQEVEGTPQSHPSVTVRVPSAASGHQLARLVMAAAP